MLIQTCKLCGYSGTRFDKHHVARRTKGNMTNTVILCRKCHSFVESNVTWATEHGFFDKKAQFRVEREFYESGPPDIQTDGNCSPAEFRAFLQTLGYTDEGWIDEKGTFWPCDEHMLHGFIASTVLERGEKDAEKEADRRGWLRLSDYGNRTAAKRLTQRQRNTLFDYCQHHGCDYHEALESIKYL